MYTIGIKGVDKTDILQRGTLKATKGADNRSSCSLSLLTTASYSDIVGQDIQVKDGSDVIFGGVIKTAPIEKYGAGTGTSVQLKIDITSNGYNDIPTRRTTTAVFTGKTAGEIVTFMVDEVLNYSAANDHIGKGTINAGATLTEYAAVCKSVKDILDDMAEASGYKWYIDDARDLHFVAEDTVTNSAHDLVEGGAFKDYDIVGLDPSLDNYRNKQFVKGGAGSDGNPIQVIVEDAAEIAARQVSEGADYSSGVYGNVIDDSNVTTVEAATTVAENALKKYGVAPMTLSFTSFTNDWVAGTKLKVNLPTFGISSDEYYLIEEVTIDDTDGVNLQSTVTATRRKADNFSTQRSEGYIEYFDKLTKKTTSETSQSGAAVVVPTALTATNAAEVAVATSEATAATMSLRLASRSRIVISFSCEITISGGAASLTAITYIDATAQTYQPTLYCASAQTYVLSFIDYKDAVEAGNYTLAVKLLTDANAGSVAIGHARMVVQVYPQAVPYLSNPTGFTSTVNGSSEIDLAWTNPTESYFTEVELYRYASSLESHDRAWCLANATAIYNGTGTSYNNTGLSAETAYFYKLFAVHTIDEATHYSAGISASDTTNEIVGATTAYVFSGYATDSIADCDEYTPDTWTSKTDCLRVRYALSASTIGTKAYVCGGGVASVMQKCDEYSPDTWTAKTDIPAPARDFLAQSTVSEKAYVFCGTNGGTTEYADCDEYTPDTWTSKTNVPSPTRGSPSASTIGTKAYVCGGNNGSTFYADCDEYTPDAWTSKTNMSPARAKAGQSTIEEKVYVYGGQSGSSTVIGDCDEYSPDTWTAKTDIPAPTRTMLSASTIGAKGYIFAGFGSANTQDCDEYDPISNAWTNKTDLPAPARRSAASTSI